MNPSEDSILAASTAKDKRKLRSALFAAVAIALHNVPEGLAVGILSMQENYERKFAVVSVLLACCWRGAAASSLVCCWYGGAVGGTTS